MVPETNDSIVPDGDAAPGPEAVAVEPEIATLEEAVPQAVEVAEDGAEIAEEVHGSEPVIAEDDVAATAPTENRTPFDLASLPILGDDEQVDCAEHRRVGDDFMVIPGCPVEIVQGVLCIHCGDHGDGNPEMVPLALDDNGAPEAVVRLVDGQPRLIRGGIKYRKSGPKAVPWIIAPKEGERVRLLYGTTAHETAPWLLDSFVELIGKGGTLGVTNLSRAVDMENNRRIISTTYLMRVGPGAGVVASYTDGYCRSIFPQEVGFIEDNSTEGQLAQAEAYKRFRREFKRNWRTPDAVNASLAQMCRDVTTAEEARIVFWLAVVAKEYKVRVRKRGVEVEEQPFLVRGKDGFFRRAMDDLINRLRDSQNPDEAVRLKDHEVGNDLLIEAGLNDLRVAPQSQLFDLGVKATLDWLPHDPKDERWRKLYLVVQIALTREQFERLLEVFDEVLKLPDCDRVHFNVMRPFVDRALEEGFTDIAESARKYHPKL